MEYRKLNQSLQSLLDGGFTGNDEDRMAALETVQKLHNRLETPWEFLVRIGWLEKTPTNAALKIAVDAKAFEQMLEGPQGIETLASKTGADPELLRRIFRLLAGRNIIHQSGPDEYELAKVSRGFAEIQSRRRGLNYMFDVLVPAHSKLPAYFSANGHQLPSKGREVWKFVTGEDKSFYEWLRKSPKQAADFEAMLVEYSSHRKHWTTFYPIEPLLQSRKRGRPFLVDVGGGLGQDFDALRNALGDHIEGELILQDLPDVILQAQERGIHPSVKAMAHDFFEAQPVTGASIYYLHSVCFNWPDERVETILRRLKDAMEPNYSRILIQETMCSTWNSPPLSASMDLVMLSIFNSKVRSQQDWSDLATRSGLSLKDVWSTTGVQECIAELVLP